jgi:hypothetical protein
MTIAGALICGGWIFVPFLHGVVFVAFSLFTLGSSVSTIGDVLFNINAASLRQMIVPDRLRGRVSASNRLLILGVQPLGALLGRTGRPLRPPRHLARRRIGLWPGVHLDVLLAPMPGGSIGCLSSVSNLAPGEQWKQYGFISS